MLDEQTTVYRLRAPAREDRLVVIEHPRRPGWDLAEPAAEGVELTPGDYRIRHALAVVPPERLVVAPDCGMKYLPRELAFRKLRAMVEGAELVRRELGSGGI